MKATTYIAAFLLLIMAFCSSGCEKEDPNKFDVTCNITFIIQPVGPGGFGCISDVSMEAWIDGYPERLTTTLRATDCKVEWNGIDFRVDPDDKIIISASARWDYTFGHFRGWDYINIFIDEEITDFSEPNIINKTDTIIVKFYG